MLLHSFIRLRIRLFGATKGSACRTGRFRDLRETMQEQLPTSGLDAIWRIIFGLIGLTCTCLKYRKSPANSNNWDTGNQLPKLESLRLGPKGYVQLPRYALQFAWHPRTQPGSKINWFFDINSFDVPTRTNVWKKLSTLQTYSSRARNLKRKNWWLFLCIFDSLFLSTKTPSTCMWLCLESIVMMLYIPGLLIEWISPWI